MNQRLFKNVSRIQISVCGNELPSSLNSDAGIKIGLSFGRLHHQRPGSLLSSSHFIGSSSTVLHALHGILLLCKLLVHAVRISNCLHMTHASNSENSRLVFYERTCKLRAFVNVRTFSRAEEAAEREIFSPLLLQLRVFLSIISGKRDLGRATR